jgi:hypothetical protein
MPPRRAAHHAARPTATGNRHERNCSAIQSVPGRRHPPRRAKIGFFVHLGIYLVVNGALIALNLLQTHKPFWALAPLLGWGIGLLFHGLKVFVRLPPQWKQRMIEQELKNTTQ